MASELSRVETAELAACEDVIEAGLETFVMVGSALLKIRDGRLYRVSHESFEEYCRGRWGMTRNYANKMISAVKVVGNLDTIVSTLPANEAQSRPLTSLEPGEQAEAWSRAVETAPNGRPTAAHVAATVQKMFPREVAKAAERERPAPNPLVVLLDDLFASVASVNAAEGEHSHGWGGFTEVFAALGPKDRAGARRSLVYIIERLNEWLGQIDGPDGDV